MMQVCVGFENHATVMKAITTDEITTWQPRGITIWLLVLDRQRTDHLRWVYGILYENRHLGRLPARLVAGRSLCIRVKAFL